MNDNAIEAIINEDEKIAEQRGEQLHDRPPKIHQAWGPGKRRVDGNDFRGLSRPTPDLPTIDDRPQAAPSLWQRTRGNGEASGSSEAVTRAKAANTPDASTQPVASSDRNGQLPD